MDRKLSFSVSLLYVWASSLCLIDGMTKWHLYNERMDFDHMDFLSKIVFENPKYTDQLVEFEALTSMPVEDEEDEDENEEDEPSLRFRRYTYFYTYTQTNISLVFFLFFKMIFVQTQTPK